MTQMHRENQLEKNSRNKLFIATQKVTRPKVYRFGLIDNGKTIDIGIVHFNIHIFFSNFGDWRTVPCVICWLDFHKWNRNLWIIPDATLQILPHSIWPNCMWGLWQWPWGPKLLKISIRLLDNSDRQPGVWASLPLKLDNPWWGYPLDWWFLQRYYYRDCWREWHQY